MMLLNPFVYASVGATDPYFANVVLLLHMNGTNGSTTITDNSSSAKTGTAAGGGSLSTAQQKFGTASWNTSSTAYVSYADSADWLFGSGQFTIECFMRFNVAPSGIQAFCAQWGGSNQFGWFFGINSGALSFFYSTTGTDLPVVSGTVTVTTNTWYHFAVDRDASNVLRVYLDGAVIASSTVSATFFDSNRTLRVGNDEGAIRGFSGYIDDLRITKGVARYGGAFSPPASEFPNS